MVIGSIYLLHQTESKHHLISGKIMSNPTDIQRAYDTTVPKLKDALAADKEKYDCTSCRIIGSSYFTLDQNLELMDIILGASTFVGLGGFTYFTGHAQLRQQQATILKSGSKLGMAPRRAGITIMSMGMAAIGMYRLVN